MHDADFELSAYLETIVLVNTTEGDFTPQYVWWWTNNTCHEIMQRLHKKNGGGAGIRNVYITIAVKLKN